MSRKRNSAGKIVTVICGACLATLLMGSMCYPAARSCDMDTPPENTATTSYLVHTSEPVMLVLPEDVEPVETVIVKPVIPEEEPPAIPYTEEDLDLFARLLTAEMGGSWIPDEIQLYVGSVVINRMGHELYPDTLYDVIYQSGQYSPTWSGAINNTPDERTIENARQLLEKGSILPENVVFQANFKQGDGVYYEYYDEILGTTTYFCYLSN